MFEMFPKLFGRSENLGSITPEQLKEVLQSIESKYTALQDENFDLYAKIKDADERIEAYELAKSAPKVEKKPKLGPEHRLIRSVEVRKAEEARVQAQEEERKSFAAEKGRLEAKLENLENQFHAGKQAIETLHAEKKELEALLAEQVGQTETIAQLSSEVKRLEALLAEQAGQAETIAQLSSEIKRLEALLAEQAGQAETIAQLSSEVGRLEALLAEQAGQAETIAQLSSEVGRLEALLAEQAGQAETIAQLSSELDQAKGEESRLQEQCDTLESTIETLESEKETDRVLIRDLENEVERLISAPPTPPTPAKPEKASPLQSRPADLPERQKRRELLARMIRGADA